jgi:MFS family permease
MEGLADSTASILKLWSGAQSDRVGRRKSFIVFGYSLPAIARPLAAIVTAPWQLVSLRVADRLGKGIRTAPRDALIADSTPGGMRGRAFGFHRAMDHLGAAIGPLLAAGFLWLWPGELRWLFGLTLIPGMIVVALVVLGLRESPSTTHEGEKPALSWTSLDNNFLRYLLALVIFTLGNSSDVFLLKRASDLGVATWALPLLWSAFHVIKSAGNLLAGPAADRFGSWCMIQVGWLIYAAVYLGFAGASSPWHIWALFAVYALFYALTEPAEKKFVADLVGPARKALAYGWFNFAMGLAALPSSLLFGFLYEKYGAWTAFGSGAALSMVAALLLTTVKVRKE